MRTRKRVIVSNRLAAETSPYLLQHAENPVDWYPVGRRGAGQGPRGGQTDPGQHRLLGLPLVPRHGARVVRERRHRGEDERPLRQHQGRSGGAARSRLALHGGGAGDDRAWRLAAQRVPDAGRNAVLWRHLFSAGRPAWECPGFPKVLEAVASAFRERREEVEENAQQIRELLQRATKELPQPG